MIFEGKTNYEVGVNPELSTKEFKIVLDKILLNPLKPAYTIPELEYEFDLKWENLKPLLDESTNYKLEGDTIVIEGLRSKKLDPSEESPEQKEHLAELENFFYKQYKYWGPVYGRVNLKKGQMDTLNPKLKKALLFAEKAGLVIVTENHTDNSITFRLHDYYRPKYHGPKSRRKR